MKSGQYRLISFYLARQLVAVPFESAIALLFTVIVYFMIGFQTVAAKYFIFAATLLLVNLISEMVGFIMGVILKVRTTLFASTSTAPPCLSSSVSYACQPVSSFGSCTATRQLHTSALVRADRGCLRQHHWYRHNQEVMSEILQNTCTPPQ